MLPLILLLAASATISGRVVDAATQAPVANAVVTNGSGAVLSDDAGSFSLDVPAGAVALSIQRGGYTAQSQDFQLAQGERRTLFIQLQPDALSAPTVEVTYEAVKRGLVRQLPFDIPLQFQQSHTGEFKGIYRVCVGPDGSVVKVVAVEPAGEANAIVLSGIEKGWRYQPWPQAMCFNWRVVLRLSGSLLKQTRGDLLPGGPPP